MVNTPQEQPYKRMQPDQQTATRFVDRWCERYVTTTDFRIRVGLSWSIYQQM